MGRLFVVSGPSGAGKTTLTRRLLALVSELSYSVSYTTRPPRPGEEDSRDYFFISRSDFQDMIENNAFLEWAEVFGRFYGTGRSWVEDRLAEGRDVLVDIDIAGAKQIKTRFPQAVFIFVVPPSLEELEHRLLSRQTETEAQRQERLGRARVEIESRTMYDYLIVNDEVERASADLTALLRAERLRLARSEKFWDQFFPKPK
ncbi:MAG: guanylate kinase [Thermodesulfobacteriota bacterium]|nr:guanylate kinase [Thermodesulfobacteriota bacterium]